MPVKEEPLQMRVGESKQRDVGKKRARIGPDAMDSVSYTHLTLPTILLV